MLDTQHQYPTDILKQLGVAAPYALLVYVGDLYFEDGAIIAHFEPASGLALASLLIGGKRYAWSLLLGAILVNAIYIHSFWASVVIASGDTLQALFGAWLLTRDVKFNLRLQSLRDYMQLILLGGCAAVFMGALTVNTVLLFFGRLPLENYFDSLILWWMSHTLGVILIAPLITVWWWENDRWREARQKWEAIFLIGLMILCDQIIFLDFLHESIGPLAKGFWMFLLITCVAMRLGTRGTVIALVVVAVQAMLGAMQGTGYFADDLAKTHLLNYWFYILILSITGMALATYFAEHKRIESDLRIDAVAFEAQEAIVITDAASAILRINKAFTKNTGYTEEEALGQKINMLKSGRHDAAFYAAMWESILNAGSWQGEIWNRRKNGEIYPNWLSITAVKGSDNLVTHYVGTQVDITERKAAEQEIQQLAFYDPLTNLPNRRLLQERLKYGIDVERRYGKKLALLMLDLDRFKVINDSFGHQAGDELLQQVALRITTRLRDVDMVARLGGDEFVVLLEDIAQSKDAARVAEEIITDLTKPFSLTQSDNVQIGASIGISLYPQHGDSLELLMDHADAALYKAKDAGRGCFAYYSEDLTRAARERIALETRLRRGIEQQELRVFYQPQVDIASGGIVGAEALVRWQDPLEGLVPPPRFIPIAEETGLIVEIGEWVLRETCRQGRQWLDVGLPPLTLAVNVSPTNFVVATFVLWWQVLGETGFPPSQLELEITESGLMENQDNATAILNSLRAQGVRLAIDDFGTGYSSLAYLKHFPLDVLKIDKSFIDDIPHNKDDMEIAATIVAMGHTLGFKVMAEGVETPEQLAFLRKNSCDIYQGFIKSRPLPAEEFAELLRNQQRGG